MFPIKPPLNVRLNHPMCTSLTHKHAGSDLAEKDAIRHVVFHLLDGNVHFVAVQVIFRNEKKSAKRKARVDDYRLALGHIYDKAGAENCRKFM